MAFQPSWLHRLSAVRGPDPLAELSNPPTYERLAILRTAMDLFAANDRRDWLGHAMDRKNCWGLVV